MKDTHLYVDLSANENSVNITVDFLLDGLVGDSQQSVSAPDGVLTEAEINTLFLLLSNFM